MYRQTRLRVSAGVSVFSRWRYCRAINGAIMPLPNLPDSNEVLKHRMPRNFLAAAGVRPLVCSAWAMCPQILAIISGRVDAMKDVSQMDIRAPRRAIFFAWRLALFVGSGKTD